MTVKQKIRKESARGLLITQLETISKYMIAKKCENELNSYCIYIFTKYGNDEKQIQRLVTSKNKELANLNRKLNYG